MVSWDRRVHNCKISGNALKQGSRTHSVLCERSSQLQKHMAARMSRRTAVDRNVCGGDGDSQDWQFKICELHNNWECAYSTQETFPFYFVGVICATTGGQNKCGLLCAVMINPPELPIGDKAQTKHISQAQVCDDNSTKNETGIQWYIIKSAKPRTLK